MFEQNGTATRWSSSQRVDLPVLTGFVGAQTTGPRRSATGSGRKTIVRHLRDRTGKVISLGVHYGRPNEPPDLIYAFENGRIRATSSRKYRRHGAGFVRAQTRTTWFDDTGRPTLQVDQAADDFSSLPDAADRRRSRSALLAAARDAAAVVLPKTLHAAETEGACLQEWLDYLAASTALAAASATIGTAAAGCAPTALTSCALITPALVAWTAALARWNETLDKLLLCQERAKTSPDDTSVSWTIESSTGRTGGWSYDDLSDDTIGSLSEEVMAFVNRAIDTGNYWCSSNGDYCIYYAAY